MDQRSAGGEAIPLLGRPAVTSLGPAKLVLRYDLPLIPARVERLRGARFAVTVHQPILPAPSLGGGEAARRMTEQVNELFGAWIRAAPEQWLCVRRRWPHRR
jgi:Kdo2-lipid IVA lauroyltransferase/acyltransferase